MDNLSHVLDNFWCSQLTIEKIDLCNKKIQMVIKTIENDITKTYNILLINVSTFYWMNNQGDNRKNINTWDFLELESVTVCSNVKMNIAGDDWDNGFYAKPNLIFEIWNSALYVKAEEIINERVYKIN